MGEVRKTGFSAMGTEVSIDLVVPESFGGGKIETVFKSVEKLFKKNESIFSRFDGKSELSRLNDKAGDEVIISGEMLEALQSALRFSREYPRIFDPRIIGDLEAAGYDRDFKKIGVSPEDLQKMKRKNSDTAGSFEESLKIIDVSSRKVLLKSRIDLAGIVKGMTVDQAVRYLKDEKIHNFIVEAGGDMYLSGKDGNGNIWTVDVEGANADLRLRVCEEGVATSGISRRRWEKDGQRFHHLINPESPQQFSFDIKSVTVIAASALEADVLAKVLFLKGLERGMEYAKEKNIKCLFLDYKNNAYVSPEIKKNIG